MVLLWGLTKHDSCASCFLGLLIVIFGLGGVILLLHGIELKCMIKKAELAFEEGISKFISSCEQKYSDYLRML